MLDEDPAKCKAWNAESSALVYTIYLKLHIHVKHTEAKE